MTSTGENRIFSISAPLQNLSTFRRYLSHEEDNENNEEKEKGEPGDSPIGNAMIRSTACNDDLDVEVASDGEKSD